MPLPAITPTDFANLEAATTGKAVDLAFASKFSELHDFLNDASSVQGIQVIRGKQPNTRAFKNFRTSPHHWYIYHSGGRNEAQLNIGMYATEKNNHVRIGLGFEATSKQFGKPKLVNARYKALVDLLDAQNPIGRQLAGNKDYAVEYRDINEGQTALKHEKPIEFLRESIEQYPWIFFGRILDRKDDAKTLASPALFTKTINTVFDDLLPTWRSINKF